MTSKRFRGSALSPLSSFPPADTLFFHHLENCQGSGKGCRICLRISISTFENHGSHTLLGVLPAVVPVANSLEFEGNPLPWAASPLFHPLTSFKGALPLLGQNLPTNPFCSHHNGRIREDRADRFRIRHPPLALACRLWHWQGVAWLELAVLTLCRSSRFQKGHPPVKTIILVPTSHRVVVGCGTKHGRTEAVCLMAGRFLDTPAPAAARGEVQVYEDQDYTEDTAHKGGIGCVEGVVVSVQGEIVHFQLHRQGLIESLPHGIAGIHTPMLNLHLLEMKTAILGHGHRAVGHLIQHPFIAGCHPHLGHPLLLGVTLDGQGVTQVGLPGTLLVLAAIEETQVEDIVQFLGAHAVQVLLKVHDGAQLPVLPVGKELVELTVAVQGVVV